MSELSLAEVLECSKADNFLSLEQEELSRRIEHRRKSSGMQVSEILKGKVGSLGKDIDSMDAEAASKSFKDQFAKETESLSRNVSKAFEKSDIHAQFKIKPSSGSPINMVTVTISTPVNHLHKAMDLVSSEAGNKFASFKEHLECKMVTRKTSKGWEIIKIENETGEKVDAVAPLIISASRRNDTPACHSDWFMQGLRRDYVRMSEKRYVSFEKARLIVFWTKDPQPIMGHLDEIDKMGIGYYFQYTLNDYQAESLEPNLPPLENRIATFKTLSDRINKEKVVWRFDPLVLTGAITKEHLVNKVHNLMKQLTGYTEKLVISFYRSDEYKHALKRMQENKIDPRDFKPGDVSFIAAQLGALGKKYNMNVATCADKGDLSLFGIDHNKCIDDELIKRLFRDDEILMSFLDSRKNLKDPTQRKQCKCIVSEEIGSNNTCANECLYCYANKSDKAVKRNLEAIKNGEIGEFLIPTSPKKQKN